MIYVGVLGPKPFLLGGHDADNPLRKTLREKFTSHLTNLLRQHQYLRGLTGLSLGTEQDFAVACRSLGIDYEVVEPFESPEGMWADLGIIPSYEKMLQEAHGRINLGGVYSPRAVMNKDRRIIQHADYVLLVHNKLIDYQLIFGTLLSTKNVIEIHV